MAVPSGGKGQGGSFGCDRAARSRSHRAFLVGCVDRWRRLTAETGSRQPADARGADLLAGAPRLKSRGRSGPAGEAGYVARSLPAVERPGFLFPCDSLPRPGQFEDGVVHRNLVNRGDSVGSRMALLDPSQQRSKDIWPERVVEEIDRVSARRVEGEGIPPEEFDPETALRWTAVLP